MNTKREKTIDAGKRALLKKKRKLLKTLALGKINIYEYNNLIKYLQAWFRKNRKEHQDLFGYELLTETLGYRSRSATYRVFRGIKFPSNQTINRFIKLLELSSEEANYLILLAHFSKIKKKSLLKTQLLNNYKHHLKKKK